MSACPGRGRAWPDGGYVRFGTPPGGAVTASATAGLVQTYLFGWDSSRDDWFLRTSLIGAPDNAGFFDGQTDFFPVGRVTVTVLADQVFTWGTHSLADTSKVASVSIFARTSVQRGRHPEVAGYRGRPVLGRGAAAARNAVRVASCTGRRVGSRGWGTPSWAWSR